MPTQERSETVDIFINNKGMIGAPTNSQVFLVLGTRLLDVHIHITNRTHHTGCLVHQPTSIGIGHQLIGWLQYPTGLMDPPNVFIGISTHFQLKTPVSLLPVTGNLTCHLFRRLL